MRWRSLEFNASVASPFGAGGEEIEEDKLSCGGGGGGYTAVTQRLRSCSIALLCCGSGNIIEMMFPPKQPHTTQHHAPEGAQSCDRGARTQVHLIAHT